MPKKTHWYVASCYFSLELNLVDGHLATKKSTRHQEATLINAFTHLGLLT